MRSVLFSCSLALMLAACSKASPSDEAEPTVTGPATGAPAAGNPAAAATAKDIFATRCTPCHGTSGAGDGPASASLTPPPRNFHDATWHASIDDAYIQKVIKYGGAAVGKSPAMPGNPDLSDDVLAELRGVVRSFKN